MMWKLTVLLLVANAGLIFCQDYDICRCVSMQRCGGGGFIDPGYAVGGRLYPNRHCHSPREVCCANELADTDGNGRHRCGERDPSSVVSGPQIKQQSRTGLRNDQAHFGEFPWMVSIQMVEHQGKRLSSSTRNICGGALIHPRVVLTTASCIVPYNTEDLYVRVGDWNINTDDERIPHQVGSVWKYIVHRNFNATDFKNDYGVIILRESVKLTETVNVACLPEANTVFDSPDCLLTGWGNNEEGYSQQILKKISMPMVDREYCSRMLATGIHQSVVCAGGASGHDSCPGDRGSPLVCPVRPGSNQYVLIGTVSAGVAAQCGTGLPGLYSNIASARTWIDGILWEYNIDMAPYRP